MKKKENRLNTIIGMLREQPTLTIRELASVLDVSEMTIRRDLAKLKDSGSVSYTHLDIISKISKGKAIELVGVGGVYNHDLRMFESDEGLHLIRAHRANKYFFSASGIHSKLGLTCSYSYEVLSKRASLESSAESILLADSSKFDVVVTSYFAKLQDLSLIHI